MAKREKRAHLSGVGCSIRAFCYGRRFVFASCGIICIYLTHVLWLMERYKQHDLIRNPPSHLHWHSSIERIQRRQNSIVAPNDVSMDDDNIHIVFSTGCNAFQDCTYLFSCLFVWHSFYVSPHAFCFYRANICIISSALESWANRTCDTYRFWLRQQARRGINALYL